MNIQHIEKELAKADWAGNASFEEIIGRKQHYRKNDEPDIKLISDLYLMSDRARENTEYGLRKERNEQQKWREK